MRKYLQRLSRQTDGGAAVELGIIFPFFTILVLGVAEYGMVMFQLMNVNHASQVGAQYAQLNGYNPPANIQAAVAAATGIPSGNVTVSEICGCSNGTGVTTTACPPPPTACGGLPAGAYVTVRVTQAYSPVAPGIASPLTAQTVVRVQ
jgi:Flp pilus assembly protein TadG